MPYSELYGLGTEVRIALNAIAQGLDVSVLGHRLSGRTALLNEVRETLVEDSWQALTFIGSASLRAYPLSQLESNLRLNEPGRNSFSFAAATETLTSLIKHRKFVFVVDNIDLLDEGSLGVIQTVAQSERVPILSSANLATASEARAITTALQIPIGPLAFEAIEKVLMRHVSATFELDAVARVYSKSGGLAGLSCRIVDAAMLSGAMVPNEAGSWTLAGDLWHPMLAPIVDSYLASLGPQERSALERVAMIGSLSLTDASRLVSWDMLQALEAKGYLSTHRNGEEQIVSPFPPVVATAFQQTGKPIRRAGLVEQISQVLGPDSSKFETLRTRGEADAVAGEPWTLHPQSLKENVHARITAARVAWIANPGAAEGVEYLNALLSTTPDRSEVERVVSETDVLNGTQIDRVRFEQFCAEWSALAERDFAEAERILRLAAETSIEYRPLFDATAVKIQTLTVGVPKDFAERLEIDDSMRAETLDEILEVRAFVFLTLGQLHNARQALESVSAPRMQLASSQANQLYGQLLLAEGKFQESVAWAEKGLEASANGEDPSPLFGHGYLVILAAVFEGNYDKAGHMSSQLLTLGEPSPLHPQLSLALRVLAVFVSIRTDKPEIAKRFLRGINRLRFDAGPLLAQSQAIALAQVDAFNGDVDAAAQRIWEEGKRNVKRGYLFAAAQQFLMSAEIRVSPRHMKEIDLLMPNIEGDFLRSFHAYLKAREAENGSELVELLPLLVSTGRPGLAVTALDLAARISQDSKDKGSIQAVDQARKSLERALIGRPIDTQRLLTSAVVLTEREWEVARLVANGFSNPEIAAQLVVATRTIESHLSRIFKKTGCSDRNELARFILSRDERFNE